MQEPPKLIRGLALPSATALNMIDMIGVGPFITIPLVVSAMGGAQAMLGWILGALLAICDGLVWAELGAAMPRSGGSYGYLREIYGPQRLGKLISFLFIWQLSFSAPLSVASGAIGFAGYASYLLPSLQHQYAARDWSVHLPLLGNLQIRWIAAGTTIIAIGVVLIAVLLLYRRIAQVGWISKLLWLGVVGTIAWIIFAGMAHFSAARAFSFPSGAFTLNKNFFLGLGSAMLISTYDYWGYYNVCFLGDEIKGPGKNIPRALLLSILLVAGLYLLMNISILGVVDWHEMLQTQSNNKLYVVSIFMQRIYGAWAANLVTVLVICILLQFIVQATGLIVLRIRQPQMPRPFRMWFYPVPAILAVAGFLYILLERKNFVKEIRYATVILIAGLIIYTVRAWRNREWPFGEPLTSPAETQVR